MYNQLECILKNIAITTKSTEKGGSFEPPPIRTDIIHYNTRCMGIVGRMCYSVTCVVPIRT